MTCALRYCALAAQLGHLSAAASEAQSVQFWLPSSELRIEAGKPSGAGELLIQAEGPNITAFQIVSDDYTVAAAPKVAFTRLIELPPVVPNRRVWRALAWVSDAPSGGLVQSRKVIVEWGAQKSVLQYSFNNHARQL